MHKRLLQTQSSFLKFSWSVSSEFAKQKFECSFLGRVMGSIFLWSNVAFWLFQYAVYQALYRWDLQFGLSSSRPGPCADSRFCSRSQAQLSTATELLAAPCLRRGRKICLPKSVDRLQLQLVNSVQTGGVLSRARSYRSLPWPTCHLYFLLGQILPLPFL